MQAKIFRGNDIALLYSQLQLLFPDVAVVKPRSSRNSSIEAFVVCRNYRPPAGFEPRHLTDLLDRHFESYQFEAEAEGADCDGEDAGRARRFAERVAVPFLACGDLRAWDSDMTYDLEENAPGSGRAVPPLEPLQPPIAAHYQAAIARAQAAAGR